MLGLPAVAAQCTARRSSPGTAQKRTCFLVQPARGGWRCRMEGSASTVGSEGAEGASNVGSEGAAGASTVGSGVEDPGVECPPDPAPQGGRGGGQPCDEAYPLTCGCVGIVQVGPGGQRGGNPNCPAGPGSRPHLCGSTGTMFGVWHCLRRLVETTSSRSPIRMVKVRKLRHRTA